MQLKKEFKDNESLDQCIIFFQYSNILKANNFFYGI